MSDLALVTGTSRGIGAATARALLERGWTVVGAARGPASIEHDRYRHVSCDLAEPDHALERIESVFSGALQACAAQRIGLVNNAGTLGQVDAQDRLEPDDVVRTLTVDLAAPILISGLTLRLAGGLPLTIVDVSSGAATAPYPGWSVYCAAKAGLRMAGQALALEVEEHAHLAGRDVRVVSYAPNVVATDMQATIRGLGRGEFPRWERFQELHAGGHLHAPEGPAAEIAALLEADDLPRWSERRYGG